MSGNLDDPAIDEFHPGLNSDVLYVTNGETTDYAHAVTGALAWTLSCPRAATVRVVFPDDEALVRAEFQRDLPFAQSVANSAVDPDDRGRSRGSRPSRSTSTATTPTSAATRASS